MITSKPSQLFFLLFIYFSSVAPSHAVEFYNNDFESPVDFSPKPVWGISPAFEELYGSGNNFETTQTASHSGTSSLKFDYNGRNGMCNLCGFTTVVHKTGVDDSLSFIAETGEDLTADPTLAQKGRVVINKTDGYSKWEILSVDNENATRDKLTLKKLNDGILGNPAAFNSGDDVFIARHCGVDGTAVNNRPERRADCNKVIAFMYGHEVSKGVSVQLDDQSIFRRVYLKQEIASRSNHQKLRYWRPQTALITLIGQTTNGETTPQVAGLNNFGGGNIYKPSLGNMADVKFERGKWYYVEEEFHTESSLDAADGYYRLWFAEAGSPEETDPVASLALEVTGLTITPVRQQTLWGNIQHTTHTIGVWYMDDLAISSDTKIGPLVIPDNDVAAPNPPTTP